MDGEELSADVLEKLIQVAGIVLGFKELLFFADDENNVNLPKL